MRKMHTLQILSAKSLLVTSPPIITGLSNKALPFRRQRRRRGDARNPRVTVKVCGHDAVGRH